MKRITGRVLASLAVLTNNAHALIAMPEKEHVQAIVWIVEAATFVTIAAAFWFVWRISKRAKENRRRRQED